MIANQHGNMIPHTLTEQRRFCIHHKHIEICNSQLEQMCVVQTHAQITLIATSRCVLRVLTTRCAFRMHKLILPINFKRNRI